VATRSPERQIQAVQRIGNLAGTLRHVFVGVAVNITLNAARDDLGLAVVTFGKFDQRRNQQLLALHAPKTVGLSHLRDNSG
jgi:hypothetical protein